MKIEIMIDEACSEPKVIVVTDKMTDEINSIINNLSQETPKILVGFKDSTAVILDLSDIFKIYSTSGKIFAVTGEGEYVLKTRLYELEEKLGKAQFVRISNSEIVNFKKVRRFDMGLTGTICVTLANGSTTYASRRYVNKIKQILEI